MCKGIKPSHQQRQNSHLYNSNAHLLYNFPLHTSCAVFVSQSSHLPSLGTIVKARGQATRQLRSLIILILNCKDERVNRGSCQLSRQRTSCPRVESWMSSQPVGLFSLIVMVTLSFHWLSNFQCLSLIAGAQWPIICENKILLTHNTLTSKHIMSNNKCLTSPHYKRPLFGELITQ